MKKTLRALNKKRGELKGALSQVTTEVGDLRDDAKTAGQQVGRQACTASVQDTRHGGHIRRPVARQPAPPINGAQPAIH